MNDRSFFVDFFYSKHNNSINVLPGIMTRTPWSETNEKPDRDAVYRFADDVKEKHKMELDMYKNNVSITSVHPGGIKTNIIANSKVVTKEGIFQDKDKAVNILESQFMTPPEKAAEKIVQGIIKNKRRVLIGRDAIFLDKMQRFFPGFYQKLTVMNSRKAFISK